MKKCLIAMMLFLIVIQGVSIGKERFQLVSALRTGYGDASGKTSYTAYHYDSEGNRIDQRVFDGADSMAAMMSGIIYSYDSKDRCAEELLLGEKGDTLSIVKYAHGSNGLLSASILRKDGSRRFKDSLLYSDEMLVEQRRYGETGTMTFYRRYTYKSKLLCADSLYEPDGDGKFTATKARLISRNDDGTVSLEAQWLLSGGKWYQTSSTVMAYQKDNLISATTYETDGTAKRLVDSLAWAYDSHGNRTKEEFYDLERVKNYEIVYTWRDTQPENVLSEFGRKKPRVISWRNGRLEFGTPMSGSVTIVRADGRQVARRSINRQHIVDLGTGLSAGRYIVMARGAVNQTLSININ